MSPASNTNDCFREFIGQKVVGVLFDALPINGKHHSSKALIFEDGRALTIYANGSFWVDSKEDVERAIAQKAEQIKRLQAEHAEVLVLAGRLP